MFPMNIDNFEQMALLYEQTLTVWTKQNELKTRRVYLIIFPNKLIHWYSRDLRGQASEGDHILSFGSYEKIPISPWRRGEGVQLYRGLQ